ncbi:MAG TPA: hypothetical protein VFE31_13275 [Opitutaceae bacterium]|jgi:hypothetical protein|nr:hypothetical protein [Opitutaceae bacterium]
MRLVNSPFPTIAARASRAGSLFNRRTSPRSERLVPLAEAARAFDDLGVFFPADLLDRWQPELTRYHE